jgi:hypothetical protein
MDFATGYLSETQNPIPHPPPSLHTMYVYTIYTYSHGKGGRGRDLDKKEGQRGSSSQSWVENTNKTDCISSL